ncbi:MAG TPA: hypothetical protein VD788_07955 [Candidatus Polarisedimenticolaceae bacterium]|nr:hypothetical protein [Candidatus Polarisedimenticolaceae bacterium]
MSCERFRDAIVGDDPTGLAEAERHAAGCGDCAAWIDEQRRLAVAVARWKAAAPAPPAELERRIAAAIEKDGGARQPGERRVAGQRLAWWGAVAASLVLALWLAPRWWSPAPTAIGEVERLIAEADRARADYARSIAELERRAMPILARAGDPDLDPLRAAGLLRYRDRLLHLDSVITEAELFLEQNPGHAGGHNVLASAYQQKQQVLGELIRLESGDAS